MIRMKRILHSLPITLISITAIKGDVVRGFIVIIFAAITATTSKRSLL